MYNSDTTSGSTNLKVSDASFRVGTSGNDTANTFIFNGMISEIIIFNRPLKNSEIASVNGYLSQKYNIKLN